MANRVFPIKVEPACLLKWSWSSVFLDRGTSASCHRTQAYPIDPNNFDQFHNLPEKIAAREVMLNGHWPGAGCQHCRRVEEAGGVSDRIYQLNAQSDSAQHPPELNTNPSATSVTPTILEVYFKNTCNMACTYCSATYSSRWEDEDRKFIGKTNTIEARDLRSTQYEQMVNDFWQYLATDDRYKVLRRFHILGGEPFLLTELDDSINFWNTHPNINLVFSIVTNLNIPTERFEQYVNQFEQLVLGNKIWKMQITASLDAWGPPQEYVRYGLDLAQWQQNFELLVSKPWITPSINSTMSSLTIKHMPELIKKINYWNSLRGTEEHTIDHVFNEPIHHSFQTVVGHVDDPYMFGSGVFDSTMQEVVDLMPDTTSAQQASKDQMLAIANALKQSSRNAGHITRLKQYLDMIDQRRQTNWRELFPWLAKDFE